jgi:dUTP pyrophosphatase
MLIPAGVRVAIPDGYALLILPRSGLAMRFNVTVANSPGLIDSDYRGEIGVLLANHSAESFTVRRGDRIAQAVLIPVTRIQWNEGETLDDTARGAGGFGSTGK